MWTTIKIKAKHERTASSWFEVKNEKLCPFFVRFLKPENADKLQHILEHENELDKYDVESEIIES